MFGLGKKFGIAFFVLCTATQANALILDTFDYSANPLDSSLRGAGDNSTHTVPGIFSPGSTVTFDHVIDNVPSFGKSEASTVPDQGGILIFDNGSGVEATLDVTYNNLPSTPVDFTAIASAFYFDFLFFDQDFEFELTVASSDGGTSQWAKGALPPGSSGRSEVLFTDFTGNVDWSSIQTVGLTLTTDNASDLAMSEFGVIAVPAPSNIALFGLVFMGLFFASRRKV